MSRQMKLIAAWLECTRYNFWRQKLPMFPKSPDFKAWTGQLYKVAYLFIQLKDMDVMVR